MKEYQILKLQSGEEIVCNLVADEHPRTFSIESPLKIVVVPRTTRYDTKVKHLHNEVLKM